jgi:hypothetical protein
MFIPVGTDRQSIWVVNKDESGKVTKDKVMDVRVSLRSRDRYVEEGTEADALVVS